MAKDARTLLTEAMALGRGDRAEIAAELLASLDEPAPDSQETVDRLWATEIERRATRAERGESRGERWNDVRDRIERDLNVRD